MRCKKSYINFPRSRVIKMPFYNPRSASYSMQKKKKKSSVHFVVRIMIRKSIFDFMMKIVNF